MSRRRYKCGVNICYDKMFDRLKEHSPLLSRGAIDTNSVHGLKAAIAEQTDKITRAEEKIQEADQQFENLQAIAKREGKSVLETMPPEILERKLLAEARFDIRREELDILKKKLGAQEAQVKQVQSAAILEYGPEGSGRLKDGILCELDGQNVSFDKQKDCLVIDCPESPYDRLPTFLYYSMVKTWKKERCEARNEAHKKAYDLALPESERHAWFEKTRRRPVSPDQWPPRPEG